MAEPIILTVTVLTLIGTVLTFFTNVFQSIKDKHCQSSCCDYIELDCFDKY